MTPADSDPNLDQQFDDLLRQKLAGRVVPPPAALWPSISQTLPPPATAARWHVPLATVVGVLIGTLLSWLFLAGIPREKLVVAPTVATRNAIAAVGNAQTSTEEPQPKNLETRNSKPETRNSKPETRNSKLETRNSKPETRNSKLKTRNPKPETSGQLRLRKIATFGTKRRWP
jgi:hypothetical protein